jgi:curved DNA-binding protein CbpA
VTDRPAGPSSAAASSIPPPAAEIKALARLLGDLDYYQILKIEPRASSETIRAAYHRESRMFHPDRHLASDDAALRDAVNAVAKRIKEAYAVLRNPAKRSAYDLLLHSPDFRRVRYTEESQVLATQAREEAVGKTPQGREFLRKAEADRAAGNTEGALRNVKMALTYEPANARFRALLDEIVKSQRGRRDPPRIT